MAKGKKTFREIVEEQHSDWAGSVQGLKLEELDQRLLALAKYQEELNEFKDQDVQLEQAQDLVKELSAPHKENMKANKLKQKYVIMLIKEKGGKA